MPITRVVIERDGKITVEGIGYADDLCLSDLNMILEVLRRMGVAVNVEITERKPEALRSRSGVEACKSSQ